MRSTILRRLCAVSLAGAGMTMSGVPAAAETASANEAAYLRVNVSCGWMQCEAWAQGGSGTYVGIEWSLADEMWDDGGVSWADASPYCVPGLMLGITASVTDSNGASAAGSAWVFC